MILRMGDVKYTQNLGCNINLVFYHLVQYLYFLK
jgi:hypothetical protein